MKRCVWPWLCAALFVAGSFACMRADAQEPASNNDNLGSALKSDAIRDEPFVDAKEIGTLAKDDLVEIFAKDGGWLKIGSTKGNGWVRLLTIRRGKPGKAEYTAEGVLALASGRAGTGKVVATTGIRGISEEDLTAARFDAAQVTRLESFGVTAAEARAFAVSGALKPRDIPYLGGEKP